MPDVNQPTNDDQAAPPDGAQNTDTSGKQDQQLGPVPYDRFKAVNDKAKALAQQLAELEARQKAEQEKQLAEQGKFRELYEKAEAERRDLERQHLRFKVAQETGLPVELSDRLAGDDESAMRADAQRLAAFVRPRTAPNIDAQTPDQTPQQFTLAQINDPAFYQQHRDAIMQAFTEGRIVG